MASTILAGRNVCSTFKLELTHSWRLLLDYFAFSLKDVLVKVQLLLRTFNPPKELSLATRKFAIPLDSRSRIG